jgi:hypothetical protein
MALTRLVTLGPIVLPTLKGDVSETVGDQLEAVGAGVVAGERRPRALALTFPVRGDYLDTNRFTAGLRLRRQVRALLENAPARLQGLYLNWTVDPELNGWLLVGGGDLKHGQGGITFADFELELSDCYRVANIRTHRPARRIIALDRRLMTTPRDTLGTIYSPAFASSTSAVRHYLPVGVTDVVAGSTRLPVAGTALSSADGNLTVVDGLAHGDIVSFEQGESDMNRGAVRILDRRGSVVETDWEQVYGPDQPLTAADIPVMENALCRLVFTAATASFDLQSWISGAWSTDATVQTISGLSAIRASVMAWTAERAVLLITGVTGSTRAQILVTLQRGWSGPRVECYTDGPVAPSIGVYAKTAGDATLQRSSGTVSIVSATSIGGFTDIEPWALLLGPGTDRAVWLSVVQNLLTLTGAITSSREGVTATTSTGYASVWLGVGARATGAADAAAHGQRGLTDAQVVFELVGRS